MELGVWDKLQKNIVINQIGEIKNMRVLDFGSGNGFMANYYARDNSVIAVEPYEKSIKERFQNNFYEQIRGDIEYVKTLKSESFDFIICHNVLEYVDNKEDVLKELMRILRKDGRMSLLKHNSSGRVMQMVVLLNDFKKGKELLDGNNGHAAKYGEIKYYSTDQLRDWCDDGEIETIYGLRAFWHLQQNQEIQSDEKWQADMISMEMMVSQLDEFRSIAMFHHIIIHK